MKKITIKKLMDIYDIDKAGCIDILSDRTNILDGMQDRITEDFTMEETIELHKAFGKYFSEKMNELYDYIDENCDG